MSKNTNTVVASAAIRKAYKAAKAAEAKGYGAFVGFISETAKSNFDKPITVATFAAFVGDDLGVGKEVSAEDKAERNRIRARIRYALESVGMLEEKARSPKQGKGGKSKSTGKAAADAVAAAEDTKATNPANRFAAVCSILRAMDRNELIRVSNELATLLAAAPADKTAETKQEAAPKAPRQRRKAAKVAEAA